MNLKIIFKNMFFDIWQGNNTDKFSDYYAADFSEVVTLTDKNDQPLDIEMNYEKLLEQVYWYKSNYSDVTIDIKKAVEGEDNHLSVIFYSSAIDNKTGSLKHRCVSGIWHFNAASKIDNVSAVVTPYQE